MLDGVRHVDRLPVDARLHERVVEEPPGRTDERLALPILAVAWLLADEHRRRAPATHAEDRLRSVLPERAGATSGSCFAQPRETRPGGDEVCGGIRQSQEHSRPLPGAAWARRFTRTSGARGEQRTAPSCVLLRPTS